MKIKRITIFEWFGSRDNFYLELDPDVTILKGKNQTGKTLFLRDIESLVQCVRKNKTTGRAEWSGDTTDVFAKVEFDAPNTTAMWVSRELTETKSHDVYSAKNYDHNTQDLISIWDPETLLDIQTLNDLTVESIDLTYSKMKDEDQDKVLKAMNYVMGGDETIVTIYEMVAYNSSVYKVRFAGKKTMDISQLSFGVKMLFNILINTPVGEGKIYFIDSPELGISDDWSSRVITGVKMINPDCQVLATTNQIMVGDEWPKKMKTVSSCLRKIIPTSPTKKEEEGGEA